MCKEPLVTVLMTTFNSEYFLTAALDSVKHQYMQDWELVVVDDGSTDRTLEILRTESDHRVRLIELGRNFGIAVALNCGLQAARGSFVARLDSDDLMYPSRLHVQSSYLLSNSEASLIAGHMDVIAGGQHRIMSPMTSDDCRYLLARGNPLVSSSVMFRRSVLVEHGLCFDTRLRNSQDYAMWVSLAQYGPLVVTNDLVGAYRMHAAQQSVGNHLRQTVLAAKIQSRVVASEGRKFGMSTRDTLIGAYSLMGTFSYVARIGIKAARERFTSMRRK